MRKLGRLTITTKYNINKEIKESNNDNLLTELGWFFQLIITVLCLI